MTNGNSSTSGAISQVTSSMRGGTPIVLLASLIGLTGFLYPFILPAVARTDETSARAGDAPFLLAIVTVLCLLAIAAEFDRGNRRTGTSSKTVALLGSLVAIDATLRLVPTFLGASPIFLLIALTGFVFGPALGFQMGTLTLLVSALLTGGIGPWLPYQMLGTGWIGLTAGWLPHPRNTRHQIWLLAGFGVAWGFLFGVLLNLWFWPVTVPGAGLDAGLYWHPGLGLLETLRRYAAFYAITSFGYDLFRAAGNAVLILLLGRPMLILLARYRDRFTWQPWTDLPPSAPAVPNSSTPIAVAD